MNSDCFIILFKSSIIQDNILQLLKIRKETRFFATDAKDAIDSP